MASIFSGLSAIGSFLESIILFLGKTIAELVYLFDLLGRILSNASSYFNWLPSLAVSFVTLIFGVAVLYKILGREG